MEGGEVVVVVVGCTVVVVGVGVEAAVVVGANCERTSNLLPAVLHT
jgi:hypothetical protein